MFSDKVEAVDVPRMDVEYQDLLRRILAIQADCEIGGPHLYTASVFDDAPTAIDQLIVARTAAEEVDHYRKIAKVAADIGLDVSFVLSWSNQRRYVEAFRGGISRWVDYAVFGLLIDRIGRFQLEEFADCSYLPLARILPQVLEEEAGHIAHGTDLTAEMARRGGAAKAAAQEAVDRWYPQALDMFGQSGSRRSERYVFWGIKQRTNEQARVAYLAEVDPILRGMGLEVPDPVAGRHYF